MREEHSINKYSFQFISSSAAKNALYAKIENSKEKLFQTIDDVFNTYFDDDVWVEIDQIRLNIGTLSTADLPNTIVTRVKTLLIAEIEKLIRQEKFQQHLRQIRKTTITDSFVLLEFYLLYGFNAILQENPSFNVDTFIEKLLQEDSIRLAALIQKNESNSAFRKRLKQFKPETLAKLKGISNTIATLETDIDEHKWTNTFHPLASYFATGTLPTHTAGLSVSDIDFIVRQLTVAYGKEMSILFLKNLSNKAFTYRLAESLNLKTLYSVFEKLDILTPILKEWKHIENIMTKWGYQISPLPSYRLLFLEYLRIPPQANKLKAQLVFHFLKRNKHLADDRETFSNVIQTINKKNIPTEISFLLHHIKEFKSHEEQTSKSKLSATAIEIIIHYFRFGSLQKNGVPIADLINIQQKDKSIALSAALHNVWKEEGVRYRIAYNLDLSLVAKIAEIVWGSHYTYVWLSEVVENINKIDHAFANGNTPDEIKNIYFCYFQFLSQHHNEQYSKKQFEEWMTLGLKHFREDGRTSASMQVGSEITQLILPTLPQAVLWEEHLSRLLHKEQSLQYKIGELNFLAQYCSLEEAQLYFEYQLEEGTTLKDLFFQHSTHHTVWPTLWALLSTGQLERMLSILIPLQYQYFKDLIGEIKAFSILIKSAHTPETIRRKSILVMLSNLQNKNYSVNKELLARRLIYELSNDDQSLFPVIENEQEFSVTNISLINFPKLQDVIKKIQANQNKNTADSILIFEEFNRVILWRFPAIAGFVFTYLSAVTQVFRDRAIDTDTSSENLLIHLYSYLLKHGSIFSAIAFVQSINSVVVKYFAVERTAFEIALLNVLEEDINRGNPRYYALKEILTSQQFINSRSLHSQSVSPDEDLPSLTLHELKKTILVDGIHAKIEFSRKSIENYITRGVIAGKDEGGFESKEQFFSFIKKFEHEHTTIFFQWMKDLFHNETEIERFLEQENHESDSLILKILSGTRHEEFSHWGQELSEFILWSKPETPHSVMIITMRKILFNLLLSKERATVGLFSYLQHAFQHLNNQQIFKLDKHYAATIEKYKTEANRSSQLIRALQYMSPTPSSETTTFSETKISATRFPYTSSTEGNQGLKELWVLIDKNSDEELQLYFEYYLEEGNAFKQLIVNTSATNHFWSRIASMLTYNLLDRLLLVLAPAQHSYFKQLLAELKLLTLLNESDDAIELQVKKKYELLLYTLHKKGFTGSKEKVADIMLRTLFSSEKNMLELFEKNIQLSPTAIQNDFPKLYAFIQGTKSDKAISPNDTSVEITSAEDTKKQIGVRFPAIADIILSYLVAAEEYVSEHSIYSQILLDGSFAKKMYAYLIENSNTFSTLAFVNEFTIQLAIAQSLYLKDVGAGLLKISEKKITNRESAFATIKEILTAQGYRVKALPEENETGSPTSALQKGHTNILLQNVISSEELKEAIQKEFPSISEFVLMYVDTVQSLSNHPGNTKNISKNDLYKKVYRYLFHTLNTFSVSKFITTFTIELVAEHDLDVLKTTAALIKAVDEKIKKGDLAYQEIQKVLSLQKLTLEKSTNEGNNTLPDLQKQHADILSRETLSFEEFKEAVQKQFPSIFEFVLMYVSVMQESLIDHPNYTEIITNGSVYKKIYRYLFHTFDTFSTRNFITTFAIELVIEYRLATPQAIPTLIRDINEKISLSDITLSTLRELLQSATASVTKPVTDKESHAPSKLQQKTPHNYLSSTLSPATFTKVIHDCFPEVAGFASTYLRALEHSIFPLIKNKDLLLKDLYKVVYEHLRSVKENFSALLFVRKINTYLSARHTLNVSMITKSMVAFTSEKSREQTSRFVALKEILLSQAYNQEELPNTESSLPVLSPEYERTVAEELSQHYRKIKFGFFHKAFDHYVSYGTFPDFIEDGFDSMYAFKSFVKAFLVQNKGEVFPVIKELLLKEPSLDRFLKLGDAEMIVFILHELSTDRYNEFLLWNMEVENFVQWVHTNIERTMLTLSIRKSLFRLLLSKDHLTVGLFSYLELVFEDLKQQGITVLTPNFPLLVERYTLEGRGNSLFVKALERIEYLLARKERDRFLKNIIEKKDAKKSEDIKLEGRLRITNAGIVMAGPFLYRYFDRLAMIENQKFKSDAHANRAVQLLQFLATGSTEMQEHELVLNKILCGVNLDAYIESVLIVTDEEKEVSESLLRGLLSNWAKIKSTSIESLREGFLMREGYLEQTELGWNLEVTRKAMDVLVDFIPWSYSLIKLAWMNLSLATKWSRTLGE